MIIMYHFVLGDGYNISQLGSGVSVSYPASPVNNAAADYFATSEYIESELNNTDINHIPNINTMIPAHNSIMHSNSNQQHPVNNFLSGSSTLGRIGGGSARFGSRKSPFQVVIPGGGGGSGHQAPLSIGGGQTAAPLSTPPACSTPQSSHYPILAGLASPNRNIGEFSTFGGGGGGANNGAGGNNNGGGQHLSKLSRTESFEPSGHLV